MSLKQILNRLKRDFEKSSSDDDAIIKVNLCWRTDGMIEYELEDGSTELITRDEFKARGGILISMDDESEV